LAQGQPVAQFTASQLSGCSPLVVNFTNTSTGALTYNWSFGNGNNSTLTSPSASYVTPGTYQVTLTAFNGTATSSTTATITVFQNPTANFSISASKGCTGQQICFTDLSTPGSAAIVSWSWDFGDGSTSSLQNPCHTYSAPGVYTVVLVVVDANGCQHTRTITQAVTIGQDFNVSVTYGNVNACAPPLTVMFNSVVTPSGSYSYNWNFGNSAGSNIASPSVVYNTNGVFTVSLTVTSSSGCVRQVVLPSLVRIGRPKADFTPNVLTGCEPLTVTMNNMSQPDSLPLTFQWSTSAGHTSSARNPSFVFSNPGVYNVRLIVRNQIGCSDTLIRNQLIRVLRRPVAEFTSDKSSFCKAPASVNFTATQTDTSIVKYEWDLGDGTTASGPNVSNTYTQEGRYTVKLKVTSSNGCVNEIVREQYVKVVFPKPVITVEKSRGCSPRMIFVKASDTGVVPIRNWTYIFRDTVRAIDTSGQWIQIPVYEAGKFELLAIGTNSDTCEVEIRTIVFAGYKLHPDFDMDTLLRCYKPGNISFTNNTIYHDSIKPDIKWKWEFGDGKGSDEEQPKHKYDTPGKYIVKLTVDYNGCESDTTLIFDTIHIMHPEVKYELTNKVCLNDTLNIQSITVDANKWLWLSKQDTGYEETYQYIPKLVGNDTILLIVFDTISGCTDTASIPIIIPQKPNFNIKGLYATVCKPYAILFTDSTQYKDLVLMQHSWYLNDTLYKLSEKEDENKIEWPNKLSINLPGPGYYNLKLKIEDQNGCFDSLIIDSALRGIRLEAKISISSNQGCVPFAVTGADQSTGDLNLRTRRWDWGDGTIDSSNNIFKNHTYTKAPLNQPLGYTIRYQITDTMGCTDTASRKVFPSKPPAGFTVFQSRYCNYDSLTFRWQSGGINGNTPYTFRWTIDDTLAATNFTFFRRFFETQRTPRVKLTVTDSRMCRDSSAQLLQIDNSKPRANFVANPPVIECPGPPVTFIDSSVRGATPIVSWRWNLGDGSTTTLRQPAKIYLKPDRYSISLTITDSAGCTDSARKAEFVIINGPWAEYTIEPKTGCAPLQVLYHANTLRTRKLEWDVGDGVVMNDHQFSYMYHAARQYIPILVLTDSNNCKLGLPATDTITVHTKPVAALSVDQDMLCYTDLLKLTNLSIHDKPMLPAVWTIGDSVITTVQNIFSYKFLKGGNYGIRLMVSDNNGCFDVVQYDKPVIVFDDTVPPQPPHIIRTTVISNHATFTEWNKHTETDVKNYTIRYNYFMDIPTAESLLTSLNDTQFTQTAVYTLHNTYSYSVAATDYCGNTSQPSQIHTTIELTAKGVPFANRLTWNHYAGWADLPYAYEILKHNPITDDFEILTTVSGNQHTYIDSMALCNVVSFYRIRALKDQTGLVYSISDTSGAVPAYVNTIPKPAHVRVTVIDNNKILLQWRKRTSQYGLHTLIYRASGEGPLQFIRQLENDTQFVDTDVDVNRYSYTYYTFHKDACGGLSEMSDPSQSILLKADLARNDALIYDPVVTWNLYNRWEDGVKQYNVMHGNAPSRVFDKLYKSGPSDLTYVHDIPFVSHKDYCYKVIAYPNDSAHLLSESNVACVSTAPRLYAPNVFTVNHDGINETFRLGGVFIQTYHIEIYNRWGDRIFESNDLEHSWDGNYNNKPCASDAYFYIAKATGFQGQRIELKGSVTLLR
jgi:gliding motility-associated-like protein